MIIIERTKIRWARPVYGCDNETDSIIYLTRNIFIEN
jgi:hypothetical protein